MRTLGRYELLRPLARGGMAEVYLARRRVAGVEKRLVIKRLRRERISDPRFLDLFVKEAQLSMTLVQQNIVPVFDFGRIGDDVFLAMEHIDGKDLGSTLSRQRGVGMPPLVAAFVASECCHALHHAHCGAGTGGRSVVHRDVTPRNVLLSWAGEVKLADFGIASAMGAGDATLVGTPGYMAPEQARGESLDARTDVYSLGLVLWEMLSGEHVREGSDPNVLIDAAKRNTLPALPEGAPAALIEILRRATDGDPACRLETARSMADHLDTFMVAERARAGGAAPAQQLASWLRERWEGAPDDPLEFPALEGGRMVTFLDDGTAGVLGTGTLRSMAATAGPIGDDGQPATMDVPPGSPDAGAVEVEATPAPRESVEDPGEGGRAEISPIGAAARVSAAMVAAEGGLAPPPPRRGLALAAVALAAGLGSVVLYRALVPQNPLGPGAARVNLEAGADDRSPGLTSVAVGVTAAAVGAVDATANADAGSGAASHAGIDGGVDAGIDAGIDARIDSTVDARPRPHSGRPGTSRPGPAKTSVDASVDAAVDTAVRDPALERRAFTIGARPWANFSIDDDPRSYETPATVTLSLGPHRVRFVNPTLGITQEVTINVRADGPASHLQILR